MAMIIAGKDCEKCAYSQINDSDKGNIVVHCEARDRIYHWGQYVPCEDLKKRGK
jgi:hypothetical protein